MDLLDELNDDTWLENLETNIEMYDDLYSEVVETVSVFHIYIDKNDDISNIKRETIFLSTDGVLRKENLKEMLKKNSYNNKKIFLPKSILKYNFYIDSNAVPMFLKTDSDKIQEEYGFLEKVKVLDDLEWKPTISLFYNLNSLYLVYLETSIRKLKNKITKKRQKLKVVKTSDEKDKLVVHNLSNKKTKKSQYRFHSKNYKDE